MRFVLFFLLLFGVDSFLEAEGEIRVGTFNVRNYLIIYRRIEGRYRPDYPKPEYEKSIIRQTIVEANPDVLASPGMRRFALEPGEVFDRIGAQKGSDHRLAMVTLKNLAE